MSDRSRDIQEMERKVVSLYHRCNRLFCKKKSWCSWIATNLSDKASLHLPYNLICAPQIAPTSCGSTRRLLVLLLRVYRWPLPPSTPLVASSAACELLPLKDGLRVDTRKLQCSSYHVWVAAPRCCGHVRKRRCPKRALQVRWVH